MALMTDIAFEMGWIVAAIVLVGMLCEIIRRLPVIAGLFVFLVLPALLSIFWSQSSTDFNWFQWAKVYSVSLGASGVVALRAHRIEKWGWGFPLIIALLVLNIIEAILSELQNGLSLNILAAVLLLLCMPGPTAVRIANYKGHREVHYPVSLNWIIAYTLWNFTFVYQATVGPEGPGGSAGFAVAHLGVPLLIMWRNPARWAQARAFGLAILMFWRFTFPDPPLLLRTPNWYAPFVHNILEGLAIGWALWLVVRTYQEGEKGLIGMLRQKSS